MRKLHHIGIPGKKIRAREYYYSDLKMYSSGFNNHAHSIEWLRFEADSPMPPIIKVMPHLAYIVDEIELEIEGKEILIPPNSPNDAIIMAFIIENGLPIEFLQFNYPD